MCRIDERICFALGVNGTFRGRSFFVLAVVALLVLRPPNFIVQPSTF
jgi:hypothetical protein